MIIIYSDLVWYQNKKNFFRFFLDRARECAGALEKYKTNANLTEIIIRKSLNQLNIFLNSNDFKKYGGDKIFFKEIKDDLTVIWEACCYIKEEGNNSEFFLEYTNFQKGRFKRLVEKIEKNI
ncbi:MAG: hypothetical protein PHX34_02405 [Candidatus Shapirobacteria bacterium]|nr:hypothetical protein [Candidatus Shapirobacteria bacterium]